MKYWITTDTHFNHRKMVEYCGRPENFDAKISKGLYDNVGAEDTLIHLGDICIGNDSHVHDVYIKGVRGNLVLVRGNHDRNSNNWYLDHGWDFVCDNFTMTFHGKRILFSHVPQKDLGQFDMNIHGHFHNNLHRLLEGKYVVPDEEERNKEDLAVLTDKHKLLALEFTNYQPVNLENFIKT